MSVRFSPVIPARSILPESAAMQARFQQILSEFVLRFQRAIAQYPPQQPTVSGYRRTGSYGRGWGPQARITRRGFEEITIENLISYATYVGGPRQSREMARRGWPELRRVAEQVLTQMKAQGLIDFRFR